MEINDNNSLFTVIYVSLNKYGSLYKDNYISGNNYANRHCFIAHQSLNLLPQLSWKSRDYINYCLSDRLPLEGLEPENAVTIIIKYT